MKTWILSDCHLDVTRTHRAMAPVEHVPPAGTELVILAGDIEEGIGGIEWADSLGLPVLYVPGNHEYYHHDIDELEKRLREKTRNSRNVTLLHNDSVTVGDVRFLGTTLWTDYLLENNEAVAKSAAEAFMADHRVIRITRGYQPHLFSADHAQAIHRRCRGWLERELEKPHTGTTVVITHHAPCIKSVAPMYIGTSPINASFASNLEKLIEEHEISLWIHGHTHWTFDYELYGTRVICNPYGYYGTTETDDFDPALLVDIQ